MHLQQTVSAEETIEGKHGFEIISASHGIIIKQYHAENDIFRANAWVQDCQERANQQLTNNSGADAHHTTGLAEGFIRDIHDNGKAMMLHAQQKWPEAITTNLWPYSIIHANNACDTTPFLAHPQRLSPLHLFTGTQVQDNRNHWKPFCFPTYVLNQALLSSKRIYQKWKTSSKVGVYLGQSTLHNHDVALVLNRDCGLVSPQLYVRYDPIFTTTKDFDLLSLWQVRAGFVRRAGHTLSRADRATKRASLSTHTSTQEGGKFACLDPLAPGRHSQKEGNPDAHFYQKEGASSDENSFKPGGASQPYAYFSQQEGASNDEIPYQQ